MAFGMNTLWNQIDTNVYMLDSSDIKESEYHVYAFITEAYEYYFEKPNGGSLHITHGSCKFDTYTSCLAEVRSIFGKPHPSMKDEWRNFNGEELEFSPESESIWSADVVGVDGAEGYKCVIRACYEMEYGVAIDGWRKTIAPISKAKSLNEAMDICEGRMRKTVVDAPHA